MNLQHQWRALMERKNQLRRAAGLPPIEMTADAARSISMTSDPITQELLLMEINNK